MPPPWHIVFRILYRFLAPLAQLFVRSGRSKDLEIIVLRRQLQVLRRQIDRPPPPCAASSTTTSIGHTAHSASARPPRTPTLRLGPGDHHGAANHPMRRPGQRIPKRSMTSHDGVSERHRLVTEYVDQAQTHRHHFQPGRPQCQLRQSGASDRPRRARPGLKWLGPPTLVGQPPARSGCARCRYACPADGFGVGRRGSRTPLMSPSSRSGGRSSTVCPRVMRRIALAHSPSNTWPP